MVDRPLPEHAPHAAEPPAPLAPDLESALRRAVLDHVATEHRRVFPPVLHLGVPGGRHCRLPQDGPRPDHALRTDLLEALFRRHHAAQSDGSATGRTLLWFTRPGDLEPEDDDQEWASAARSAGSELGVVLPLVVVTRQGWRDTGSGAGRTWRRLRAARQ